jgi:uncharacterized protein (DUF1499 family)
VANHVWTERLSRWALRLGIATFAIGLGGAFLAGQGVIPKTMGLYALLGATLVAVLGTLCGLVAVLLNWRFGRGLMASAVIGLLLSGGYAGFMASRAVVARGVPPIHDVTTDLANPPGFTRLKLGADNLRGLDSVAAWQTIHKSAYSDIKPLTLPVPPAQAIARAEALARQQGWEIALSDPATGRLEATASVSLIKYQDDVVITATPTPDGKGSIVNMRSVSRIGISDLGVNAKRVRAFLAALSKEASPSQ